MVLLYVLALLVTGLFTLWPGRVMNQVLLGAKTASQIDTLAGIKQKDWGSYWK